MLIARRPYPRVRCGACGSTTSRGSWGMKLGERYELLIRCSKCLLSVTLAGEDVVVWERALNLDDRSHARRRRKLTYRIARLPML